jgi:hypothetical protein
VLTALALALALADVDFFKRVKKDEHGLVRRGDGCPASAKRQPTRRCTSASAKAATG